MTRVISFKNTALFKRGIWFTAAALAAFLVVPYALGGFRQNLAATLFPACILVAFCVYFLRKSQIHRVADEVEDCDDHLKVRRGKTREIIPFSNISLAVVSSGGGMPRITLRLRKPTTLGNKIDFLPQASLWSSPAAIGGLAADLSKRASRAAD